MQPRPATSPQGQAGDAWDRAAQAAGIETPQRAVDTSTTSIWLKLLIFPLWFKDLRRGAMAAGGVFAVIAIVYFAGWQTLIVGAFAGTFAWWWWKRRDKVDWVYVIEIRAEGQRFKYPHTPMDFKVPDSGFRMYQMPRRVYDRAIKFGAYQPIFPTPSWLVFCDYADPEREIMIFNQDPEWSNVALVAQMNEGLARNLRRRSRKEDWLKKQERLAFQEYRSGQLSYEDFVAIVGSVQGELDIVHETNYNKRSFLHYYQDAIPRLKQQLMRMVQGLEEYSHALGSKMAYELYGQPMSVEVEQQINMAITKHQKIRLSLLDEWSLEPEAYEELANVDPGFTPALHELSQRPSNAGAYPSSRPAQMVQMLEREGAL